MNNYIQADDGTFINENHIVWVTKIGDCYKIGTTKTTSLINLYMVCKSKNLNNHNKLKLCLTNHDCCLSK